MPGRLVLLLGAVALLGVLTAAFGHFILGAFPSYGEALWSATSHLIDPGSIGDDNTNAERTVGLVQVIVGIIFFAGIVLTVLTEVFDRALRRLQKGDPAVRRRDHLLIVGASPSLAAVQSRIGVALAPSPPELVVMLPLADSGQREQTRRSLAGYPARTTVVVADPGEDGYERVCAQDARSIVLLSPEGEPDEADLEVTDRAVLLSQHLESSRDSAPPVAAEIRRGRNAQALWMKEPPDGSTLVPRFPENFDALVDDRNIGAVLSLAVLNPTFATVILGSGDARMAPNLTEGDQYLGQVYSTVREKLGSNTLLGILSGSGPSARAIYLPDENRRIEAGDRLIIIAGDRASPGQAAGPDPASIKVAPTRPGPCLMIGWSDATRALVEELETTRSDLSRVHLLNLDEPPGSDEPSIQIHRGDPGDPEQISRLINLVEPEIIWVASPQGNESAAVVGGMLARQMTDAVVVIEQSFSTQSGRESRVAAGLTAVSTAGLMAETVALSNLDPAVLAAREQMLDDPAIRLESLTYTGSEPLPLAGLPALMARGDAAPLALSLADAEGAELGQGDHILALRRLDPAS